MEPKLTCPRCGKEAPLRKYSFRIPDLQGRPTKITATSKEEICEECIEKSKQMLGVNAGSLVSDKNQNADNTRTSSN